MSATYGVIDLFAGPGGLGEGFASLEVDRHHPFRIGMSVEKEESAWKTLRLRAFLREVRREKGRLPAEYIDFHAHGGVEPDWRSIDSKAWGLACEEACHMELGTTESASRLAEGIAKVRQGHEETVLIGGPPCQAYSLVGRARVRGVEGYSAKDDPRHFLFREYVEALDLLRPAAFVLENVKGVLSSKVDAVPIFEEIMRDVASLGGRKDGAYRLLALSVGDGQIRLIDPERPSDFIVRAERFGVPQRRHRVIVIGVRSDLGGRAVSTRVPLEAAPVSVSDAIGMLPAVRSGLSRGGDGVASWKSTVIAAAARLEALSLATGELELAKAFASVKDQFGRWVDPPRRSSSLPAGYARSNHLLLQWLENEQLISLAQHDSRGHIAADLERYLFASVFGATNGRTAKMKDYPASLAPNHESWTKGIFSDRFRVQLAGEPSTTITSHISKDGHYFIHPDPKQCRSLTVREAARLQTFPDDYLFLGNRTQQYVQVGNAVPPFLARTIASLLLAVLEERSSSFAKQDKVNHGLERV